MKVRKNSNWDFYIPNDEEGRKALELIKKYRNKKRRRVVVYNRPCGDTRNSTRMKSDAKGCVVYLWSK